LPHPVFYDTNIVGKFGLQSVFTIDCSGPLKLRFSLPVSKEYNFRNTDREISYQLNTTGRNFVVKNSGK
jgi:hypothetical protein